LTEDTDIDVNAIEPSIGKAPLHSILTGNRSERLKFLEVMLIFGLNIDINLPDLDGNTPLHLAIKVC